MSCKVVCNTVPLLSQYQPLKITEIYTAAEQPLSQKPAVFDSSPYTVEPRESASRWQSEFMNIFSLKGKIYKICDKPLRTVEPREGAKLWDLSINPPLPTAVGISPLYLRWRKELRRMAWETESRRLYRKLKNLFYFFLFNFFVGFWFLFLVCLWYYIFY